MAQFDADDVFAYMQRRGFVPTSSAGSASGFTQAEFLLEVAGEIESNLLPMLVRANTKHLLQTQDQSIVSGTSTYRLPERCANNGVYSVWMVASGSTGYDPLDEIDPGDVPKLGIALTGKPIYYAFEGANLVLYPTPDAAGQTLRIKYQIRPNRLVLVTNCGRITVAAAAGATSLTVGSSAPSSTSGPFDIVRGTGSFDHIAVSATGTRSSTVVTIPAGIPAAVAVGDYVCNAMEAPFPQLPHGLHLPAAMRGVAAICAAKGNRELAAWLKTEAASMEKLVLESLVPRNQTMQQSLVNSWW